MKLEPAPDAELVERFLVRFRLAARQAAALARHLRGELTPRDKSDEDTPEAAALTAADLAAQDVILLALHDALPDVAVDAEEDTPLVPLFPGEADDRPLVVIDPIDGTWNYAHGSTDYAVMGGLVLAGRFEAAVVAFPEAGLLVSCRRGDGVRIARGGDPPETARPAATGDRVLVTPRVPGDRVDRLKAAGLAVERSRCSAVDGTAPATGRAAASVAWGPSDRRRETALFVTHCAGGAVLADGRPWSGEAAPPGGREERIVVAAGSMETATRVSRLVS